MVNVTPGLLIGSILERGVARRSLGLLRHDLLLQIGPSVTDLSAGYILRRTTAHHKLPLRPSSRRTLAATAPVSCASAVEKPCYQTVPPLRAQQPHPYASALASYAPCDPDPVPRAGTEKRNGYERLRGLPKQTAPRWLPVRAAQEPFHRPSSRGRHLASNVTSAAGCSYLLFLNVPLCPSQRASDTPGGFSAERRTRSNLSASSSDGRNQLLSGCPRGILLPQASPCPF